MKLLLLVLFLLPCCVFQGFAEPTSKATYRITGVAVSARDGAPVPYCRMQISELARLPTIGDSRRGATNLEAAGQRNRPQAPPEVDADARGHFQIGVDHPGTYLLTGSARDFRRQSFDQHEGFTSGIVVTAAAPIASIVFRMEHDASIAGLVLDEAGEPVRGAQVTAETPGQAQDRGGARSNRGGGIAGQFGLLIGGFAQSGFAQTDDRGRYELSGLAPGVYRVRVQAQPWYASGAGNLRLAARSTAGPSLDPSLDLVYATVWFPGVDDDSAAESIRLGGGEERQADFHLTPFPAVHLIVPRPEVTPAADGQPRPQRGTVLTRISPAGGGFSQSIADGNSLEFGGLSPGVYELRTVGEDGRPGNEAKQFRILPGSSGVVDLSSAQVLTKVTLMVNGVEAGELGQISFVDASTGRNVSPDGGFGRRRRDDANAPERERSVALAPGRWEVHLPLFAATYLIGLDAVGAKTAGATIMVGEQPVTLTIHLASGRAEVSGVAVLGDKPAQGAMVLLVPATLGEPASVAELEREETNTDGSFLLRGVVPGKYILLAIDHGWGVKWRDPATLAGYLARGVPIEVAAKAKVERKVNAVEP